MRQQPPPAERSQSDCEEAGKGGPEKWGDLRGAGPSREGLAHAREQPPLL